MAETFVELLSRALAWRRAAGREFPCINTGDFASQQTFQLEVPMAILTLREQLLHVAQQWQLVADQWDSDDLAAHVKAQQSPVTFMSTVRVIVLRSCIDSLRHALEEYRHG